MVIKEHVIQFNVFSIVLELLQRSEEWASSEPDYIQKNQFSVSFRDFLTIRNIWMIANRKNAKQCWVNLSSQSKQEVKPGNFEINKSDNFRTNMEATRMLSAALSNIKLHFQRSGPQLRRWWIKHFIPLLINPPFLLLSV